MAEKKQAPPTAFRPGVSGNPAGRPRLPDWFKSRAPEALQHLLNVATGTEPAEPDLRLKAAALVVDRYYGKAAETVEVDVGARDSLLDALLAVAHPRKSEGQNEPNSDSDGENRGGA